MKDDNNTNEQMGFTTMLSKHKHFQNPRVSILYMEEGFINYFSFLIVYSTISISISQVW